MKSFVTQGKDFNEVYALKNVLSSVPAFTDYIFTVEASPPSNIEEKLEGEVNYSIMSERVASLPRLTIQAANNIHIAMTYFVLGFRAANEAKTNE